MDIILVHGYNVTSTKTYGVLPQRLKRLGYNVKNVYISKYVTLDDGVTMADIVKGFQAALLDVYGKQFGKKKFACLTHSTGGLVARAWIHTYYGSRLKQMPLSHLIMMAPPNHGSRLANLGKSRLSRLRSLWGAEPGLQILDALELGSQYQWTLDQAWLDGQYHKAPGFFPTVITGQWIDKKIFDFIIPATYERGSDGVVRASSANLNLTKMSMDADGHFSKQEIDGVPYLITPKTAHSDDSFGIMGSIPETGDHPVLSAIIQVLQVKDNKNYQTLFKEWALKTATLQGQELYYDGSPLQRYSQLVVRTVDNDGNQLQDYTVELLDAQGRGDQFPGGFLPHSQQNTKNKEFFVFYFNYDQLTKVSGGQVQVKVHSVPESPLISYEPVQMTGSLTQVLTMVKPNQTTALDIILKRRINKNLYRLTDNFSYQKITGEPSEDWID